MSGSFRRLLRAGAVLALLAVFGCGQEMEPVKYAATDELFANPERGFYLPADTHSNRYRPLDAESLRAARIDRQMSLVYRGFILDDFVDAPISADYLRSMAQDFTTLREAGMKSIVRFAYTTKVKKAPGTDWPPIQPYGDAPLEQVLAHMDQLEPLLRANADVIAVVQAGFVGIWGEWFYTDHYSGANLDVPGDTHWQRRSRLVERLLALLPENMSVQVRTPLQKQRLTGSLAPLSATEAWTTTARARLGHHNDCFLAGDTDLGTYRDTTADFAYMEVDSRFVPVGGETCGHHPPRSECASAVAELARFHWSYLNSAYHPGVLSGWETAGCMTQVLKRLGYRLVLGDARFAPEAKRGGLWQLELRLRNEGFAAPYRPRSVAVVLRQRDTQRTFRADLDVDLRRLLPAQTLVIERRLGLPADMPAGVYGAYLHLSDPDPGLASRPEYAVRLAAAGIWEAETGYNSLDFEVTVPSGRSWWPSSADLQFQEVPPDVPHVAATR